MRRACPHELSAHTPVPPPPPLRLAGSAATRRSRPATSRAPSQSTRRRCAATPPAPCTTRTAPRRARSSWTSRRRSRTAKRRVGGRAGWRQRRDFSVLLAPAHSPTSHGRRPTTGAARHAHAACTPHHHARRRPSSWTPRTRAHTSGAARSSSSRRSCIRQWTGAAPACLGRTMEDEGGAHTHKPDYRQATDTRSWKWCTPSSRPYLTLHPMQLPGGAQAGAGQRGGDRGPEAHVREDQRERGRQERRRAIRARARGPGDPGDPLRSDGVAGHHRHADGPERDAQRDARPRNGGQDPAADRSGRARRVGRRRRADLRPS